MDSEQTARHIREVEAESVALICCETLGIDGADFCRGYIQHWLKTEKEIPNQSVARIFAAATSILKAGTSGAGCPFSVCWRISQKCRRKEISIFLRGEKR